MMDSLKGSENGRCRRVWRTGRLVTLLLLTPLLFGKAVAEPSEFRDLSPQERATWLDNLDEVLDSAKLPVEIPAEMAGESAPAAPGPWNQMRDSIQWRVDAEGFVVLEDGKRPMGSRIFARSCYLQHDDSFDRWAEAESKSRKTALLVATAITESGCSRAAGMGSVDGLSTGLMQVTGGTCLDLLRRIGRTGLTKQACLNKMAAEPDFSIHLAAVYITQPAQLRLTKLEAPKVAAAYNSGGVYFDPHNPWRLRSTGNHIDRFVAAYNSYLGWRKDEDAGHKTRGPVLNLRQSASLPPAVPSVADLSALDSQASDGDIVFVGDWQEKLGDFFVFVGGQWRPSLEDSPS